MPLLEVKNLRTYFHTRNGVVRAVDDVSFAIERGETLGIVGESGSGKSVTCYSMLGLIPQPPGRIESGTAIFDGVDLLKAPPAQLRQIRGKRIAMIFQDPMTSLTVQAQIIELVKRMQAERGMAVIWISHDLGVVAGLCRRVNVMYAGRVVESGPTEKIFRTPQHPYNRALQKSIPALQAKGTELYTIAGMPPDLTKPLAGCAFAGRCEFAQDVCRQPVALKPVADGHATACVRVQNGELKL